MFIGLLLLDFSYVLLGLLQYLLKTPIPLCINKSNKTTSFGNNQWKADWTPVQPIFTFQGMINIHCFSFNIYYNLKISC